MRFPFSPVRLFVIAALFSTARLAAFSPEEIQAESAKANDFFDRVFQERLDRSPEYQAYLGIKKDNALWDDDSDARATEDLALTVQRLAELKRTIDASALDPQTLVSYQLWVRQAERSIDGYKWRLHNYPVDQMNGMHSDVPGFLIGMHRIDNEQDAIAYISRLHGIRQKFATLTVEIERRRVLGIVPPRFVFPLVLDSCRNLISGEPFDQSGKKTALLEDFETKLAALKDLPASTRARLLSEARGALTTSVKPAYEALIATLEALEKTATEDAGVWKFPEGAAYYNHALRRSTTTDLSAEQIHALGLREVARIRTEMQAIMRQVGFTGDLAAFFKFMREDARFYYPNNAEGKAAYLTEATAIIDRMRGRLDTLFLTKPRAAIIVKPVEAFREKEAGGAFYYLPAVDGSRPGTYYVNLYDMGSQPKYEMEALAYHEGLPGHHMQIAIAQELTSLPRFRRMGWGYTAYVEGWGLYCEQIPKEIGCYADPYSDFGRLSMELMRAGRLVVDTGLHAERWTRQQAIDWLRANTPDGEREIVKAVNRYIVMPGQATAYKIGMMKLLELRALAARELGEKFDLREYHDVVLRSGPMPLDMLEEQVRSWIAAKR